MTARKRALKESSVEVARVYAPLYHVVQEAAVVDLPLGGAVPAGLLEGPHHVTRCRCHKRVQVPTPRSPSLRPGLRWQRRGCLHALDIRPKQTKQGCSEKLSFLSCLQFQDTVFSVPGKGGGGGVQTFSHTGNRNLFFWLGGGGVAILNSYKVFF